MHRSTLPAPYRHTIDTMATAFLPKEFLLQLQLSTLLLHLITFRVSVSSLVNLSFRKIRESVGRAQRASKQAALGSRACGDLRGPADSVQLLPEPFRAPVGIKLVLSYSVRRYVVLLRAEVGPEHHGGAAHRDAVHHLPHVRHRWQGAAR